MLRLILLLASHGLCVAAGFAAGIYFLPILTAPDSPDAAVLQESARDARFTVELTRELRGSDRLHWGEGTINVGSERIVHEGRLAPGPDYRVYLVDRFVEHEEEFLPIKGEAHLVGPVRTFEGFVLDLPEGVDVEDYTTVLVWCEAFSEFITAAEYR